MKEPIMYSQFLKRLNTEAMNKFHVDLEIVSCGTTLKIKYGAGILDTERRQITDCIYQLQQQLEKTYKIVDDI